LEAFSINAGKDQIVEIVKSEENICFILRSSLVSGKLSLNLS
jgi:hypothetical protein